MKHHPSIREPALWEDAKYVSWPPSHAKPMVRIPLPSGRYKSLSVSLEETEAESVAKCRSLRDKVGIAIWGKARWQQILSVPARSSARPRRGQDIANTPQEPTKVNGVTLVEREGMAAYWLVSWYELEDLPAGESRTHGRRQPRIKRRKTFSFGTANARFSSSEAAYAAAVAYREEVQRRHYTSSDGVGYRLDLAHPHGAEQNGG